MPNKRQTLSIDQKVKVIQALESGVRQCELIKHFGLKASAVTAMWRDREKLQKDYLEGKYYKRLKKPKHVELDQAILSWVQEQRRNNVSLSGPIIKKKAEILAKERGIENFMASNGWLSKFKKRNRITVRRMTRNKNNKTDDRPTTASVDNKQKEYSDKTQDDASLSNSDSVDLVINIQNQKAKDADLVTIDPLGNEVSIDSKKTDQMHAKDLETSVQVERLDDTDEELEDDQKPLLITFESSTSPTSTNLEQLPTIKDASLLSNESPSVQHGLASTTSELPSIPRLKDVVSSLRSFLMFCQEDPIISDRLNEITTLGKS